MITDETSARFYVSERCSVAAMDKLDRFVELLVAESAKQNLVARQSLEVVWQRHIADSAQLLEHVPRETGLWLDLGTGAGLPGIIIAIMRPE
ncbi:MAG: RsmG family class I SAM-dependent methyltransferase, partial [Allopontixanthobacter sediminis]